MLVIGLTGGIGCGKTTVAKLFAEHHVPIIDADLIARELVEPGQPALEKLIDKFGPNILRADQTLDRQKLRELIFNDDNQRKALENILHPLIRDSMIEHLDQVEGPYVVLVIPLLVDTGNWGMIDRILVIDANEELQIERIMQRDRTDRQQAKKIVDTQISRNDRLEAADDVIDNSGDISELREQVDQLHELYLAESNSDNLENAHQPKSNGAICYEHPLNERIRTFLRLEHLFNRAKHHQLNNTHEDAQSFISLLLEINNLVARGDIKSEILKELERQQGVLKQHSQLPDVNQNLLDELLKQQNVCIERIHAMQGKLGQHLQNDLLFNSIRQRLNIPGGSSEFDLPILNYWLYSSEPERLITLSNWLQPFESLKDAIDVCLNCIRQSTEPTTEKAQSGYYEEALDKRTEAQLIRVLVEKKEKCYPTISANKHRLNVRFMQWRPAESRLLQSEKDISFSLMICRI